MRRWLFWVPVLMVGATFYWTLALGLGALSFHLVGNGAAGPRCSCAEAAHNSGEPVAEEAETIVIRFGVADPGDHRRVILDPQVESCPDENACEEEGEEGEFRCEAGGLGADEGREPSESESSEGRTTY